MFRDWVFNFSRIPGYLTWLFSTQDAHSQRLSQAKKRAISSIQIQKNLQSSFQFSCPAHSLKVCFDSFIWINETTIWVSVLLTMPRKLKCKLPSNPWPSNSVMHLGLNCQQKKWELLYKGIVHNFHPISATHMIFATQTWCSMQFFFNTEWMRQMKAEWIAGVSFGTKLGIWLKLKNFSSLITQALRWLAGCKRAAQPPQVKSAS